MHIGIEKLLFATALCAASAGAPSACLSAQDAMPMKQMDTTQMMAPMGTWPAASKDAAMFMMKKYGAPAAMYDDLAMYDGSVVLERTSGEMSARCDKESANFLALNLANEIVTGKRTVADSRRIYGAQIMEMKAMRPAPYTEKLMFTPMMNTNDPDQSVSAAMTPAMPGMAGMPAKPKAPTKPQLAQKLGHTILRPYAFGPLDKPLPTHERSAQPRISGDSQGFRFDTARGSDRIRGL